MLIFLAEGRLGNQLFQYAFLKTIQKNNEKIIVSGFDDIFNVFEINDETLVNISLKSKWIRMIIYKIIKPILYKLSDLKIISFFQIKHEKILGHYRREALDYEKVEGLIKNIKFVKLGYLQSEFFFKKEVVNYLKIREKFLKVAEKIIQPINDKYKVFVHIRRGDYRNFKVLGKNPLLPMHYFHNQIKWFLENKKNCYFIFLSDEPDLVEKEFEYFNNKLISRNSYEVDFAIMTLCNGAILSPSSFGWWGSYLMKNRDVVFAPKYWLGFESKMEFPCSSRNSPSYSIEIDVTYEVEEKRND